MTRHEERGVSEDAAEARETRTKQFIADAGFQEAMARAYPGMTREMSSEAGTEKPTRIRGLPYSPYRSTGFMS